MTTAVLPHRRMLINGQRRMFILERKSRKNRAEKYAYNRAEIKDDYTSVNFLGLEFRYDFLPKQIGAFGANFLL